jgi:hypothetical protein
MKSALILILLAATLSGCMTAPPGHATVTLHDAHGLPAATVATLQPANPETAAQVTLRRKGDHIEITTTTGRSRAAVVPSVGGLSLWTILGGLSLIGGLLLTGWHFCTGLTLALGGILMAILAQIFGQSWFPAVALLGYQLLRLNLSHEGIPQLVFEVFKLDADGAILT